MPRRWAARTRCRRSPRSGSRWARAAPAWSSPTSSKSKPERPERGGGGSLAEKKLADLEAVFAALAHEQRRHILLVLRFRGGEMTAGAIADRFHCSWPTTTRHLKVLVDAGLVSVDKRGRERFYRLETERLLGVTGEWLAWFEPGREPSA